jgi:tRNA A37 threonylcarbamoyltransferase TsaD
MTISHRTLAIETSCDDTSLAIVFFDGKKFMVEKMLAYSQINEHQQF